MCARTQPGGALVSGPTTVSVVLDPQQENPIFAPALVESGLYKLRWDFGPSISGGSKQKVFQVNCGEPGPGTFAVTKTVSGTNAPSDWAFTVHIACTGGFESDAILTDENPTSTVSNLDVGETCTVSEPDSQGATTTYSPAQTSDPVPERGGTVTITIDNKFTATPPRGGGGTSNTTSTAGVAAAVAATPIKVAPRFTG